MDTACPYESPASKAAAIEGEESKHWTDRDGLGGAVRALQDRALAPRAPWEGIFDVFRLFRRIGYSRGVRRGALQLESIAFDHIEQQSCQDRFRESLSLHQL